MLRKLSVAGKSLILLTLLAPSVYASNISLQYEVQDKGEGYINFILNAENISLTDLSDVTIESSMLSLGVLYYGDIEVGQSAAKEVALSWDTAQEPPTLTWTISYTDENGQPITEVQ